MHPLPNVQPPPSVPSDGSPLEPVLSPKQGPKKRKGRLWFWLGFGGLGLGIFALTLPSAMSCGGGKAFGSEARTYIGSMNRAQQAMYLETGQFVSNIDALGLGMPQMTRYFQYSLEVRGPLAIQYGVVRSTPEQQRSLTNLNPLKLYSQVGAVAIVPTRTLGVQAKPDEKSTIAILCQALEPGPRKPNPPVLANNQLRCGGGTEQWGRP